jgi:alpha-L-fucosidase
MPEIAAMARGYQPGLIIVDRSVTGKYENYRTPEQYVPDDVLDYPWAFRISDVASEIKMNNN